MRRLLPILAVALAACGVPPVTGPGSTEPVDTTATTTLDPAGLGEEILSRCHETPLPSADLSFYRDTPKYVGNEMPVDEVRRWATGQPGFVDIWIDRDHYGWVAVGFTVNAAERQAEIQELFPDDGVVAVQLDWTPGELVELEDRVHSELDGVVELLGTSVDELRGYVSITVPVLEDEVLATIAGRFPGERICVDGLEPEDVVPAGPQPQEGDGWRLLIDHDEVGFPYEVGIAWDSESLDTLLDSISGLGDVDFDVDFETEIVIWFGAVHGSSCPNLRLDDVVVDGDTLYAEVVNTDNAMACTSDAIPHTYLVAVEREVLPAAPFHVALSTEPWVERVVVEADLRQPGSTASPDQVFADPDPPGREPEGSGVIIETGFPWEYTVDLACGFEAIGEINSFHWVTNEEISETWLDAAAGAKTVVVEVLLQEGPEPTLEVTFQGETVAYQPTNDPGCPGG